MKTVTLARLSLLMPLLVWVLCLPMVFLASILPRQQIPPVFDSLLGGAGLVIVFYVIGIIYWALPYLFMSLILFLLTFRVRVEVLRYIYALSPFVMAILMMSLLALLTLPSGESSLVLSDLAAIVKY